MYGVESCVHPDYQGQGVGSKLMDARFDTLRRLNLRGLVAGGMIMDYHKVAHLISPEDYVREVVEGKRYDNNLTKQIHKGFRVLNLIPDYCEDPRALNYGVAIVWDNPDYQPGKRPAPRVRPGNYNVTLRARTPAAVLHGGAAR
jgi:ribosomal protein S18 acetylase RimI-like enzyme